MNCVDLTTIPCNCPLPVPHVLTCCTVGDTTPEAALLVKQAPPAGDVNGVLSLDPTRCYKAPQIFGSMKDEIGVFRNGIRKAGTAMKDAPILLDNS